VVRRCRTSEEAEVLKLSMQSLKEYYGLNPGRHAKSAREILPPEQQLSTLTTRN
jgi:hypothetical protein